MAARTTKAELASKWEQEIAAADRIYDQWANRFKVRVLNEYYEGFHWLLSEDSADANYVINLIYSVTETKLPGLIFNSPKYTLEPRPFGDEFDLESALKISRLKEDVLNFICNRQEFGFNDKHALAILDAFTGFGVLHTGYSDDNLENPNLRMAQKGPLSNIYCKRVPFETFRVASTANWDLSSGRWYGYYEWLPATRLTSYIKAFELDMPRVHTSSIDTPLNDARTGLTLQYGESNRDVGPENHVLVWRIWDHEWGKHIIYSPHTKDSSKGILLFEDFVDDGISTLRLGFRRTGWYPLPPIFNWISPQDEINEIRQAQKLHRKRFSRKYMQLADSVDEEEKDKFLYGPDGTVFTVKRLDALKAVEDPPLDPTNLQSLVSSYDDVHRVSGTPIEERNVGDRTTATQSSILARKSQIRESKDVNRVGIFLTEFGRNILKALRGANATDMFWIQAAQEAEGFLGQVANAPQRWVQVPGLIFASPEDSEVSLSIESISPVAADEGKKTFVEFLSLLTQYEILAFSPALIREAAHRVGYRNNKVLAEFQTWAQLAAIGRTQQLQAAAQMPAPMGVQPGGSGEEMAQATNDKIMGPDQQQIMNAIFNRKTQVE